MPNLGWSRTFPVFLCPHSLQVKYITNGYRSFLNRWHAVSMTAKALTCIALCIFLLQNLGGGRLCELPSSFEPKRLAYEKQNELGYVSLMPSIDDIISSHMACCISDQIDILDSNMVSSLLSP